MRNDEKRSLKTTAPFIVIVVLIMLLTIPLPYYIEGPGTTENLKNFVLVKDREDSEPGGFYLTTVGVKRATMLSIAKAKFSFFEEIVTKKELMGSSTSDEYNRMQKYYMDSSQNTAIEQALKLADIPYTMNFKGVYVLSIDENSDFKGKISIGDTVTGINGETFTTSEALVAYVKKQKVNQEVTVNFLQDGKEKEAKGKLMALPSDKKPGIGIALVDHTEIDSSIPIEIDAGSIGGPSAGLMFTLESYELLSDKNSRKGYKIAGTGTISSEGIVGRIGGIDKKIVTASNNHAEIFFAPDDEINEEMKKDDPYIQSNYEEAKAAAEKIGTDMKVVPAKTIQDALDYLASLKEKK